MHTHALATSTPENVILEIITYDRQNYNRFVAKDTAELIPHIKNDEVNWVNLDGLSNMQILENLQEHFSLNSLLVEDILTDQRPKAEEYEDYLFVTLKMLYRINGVEVDYEQISFVLGSNYLLTFQEKEGDLFDAFRERIRLDQGRVRKKKADYLMYRLIDITVENYYNVLDNIGEQIDAIEATLRTDTSGEIFQKIQSIKKELIYLHKALYPLRDALSKILKDESDFILQENIPYFSDVYDHVIHLIDSLDTYRDLSSGLTDQYINIQNSKLNEVIRVLTIISTIFIPLTFIVGVYGMNFEYFPELHWEHGYATVWVVMLSLAGGMVGFFRYKKWI
ncbi:MAG TPA: magnesium/cobalt transporter CorA [Chryseosolibacter sp.]